MRNKLFSPNGKWKVEKIYYQVACMAPFKVFGFTMGSYMYIAKLSVTLMPLYSVKYYHKGKSEAMSVYSFC